jgi:hypothetical protein
MNISECIKIDLLQRERLLGKQNRDGRVADGLLGLVEQNRIDDTQ